ncbi:serine/threonine-protein kinase [Streptomyces sp. CT34]|uniref:serine/threonine-protein kinase n=1 Tax=Streptomyces sp. CT34 TaxID=1553907 RepID=UPI001F51CF20|nr:serine/threonine-protein kinase [Streptomyces sp. CT34]
MQEPIGQGGMGIVWQARDELLDRRVAVKCARPDDVRAAQRLMKEARYAARLHHPNVVAVFDYVTAGDACWIVMEYVPSRSLAQLVAERGPLCPQEAGSIGGQIAAALAKSHGEGVVHGDVTPENILVTDDGVARLTDFGIARALWSEVTQTGTHTTTGTVRGKPRYLAPEVARGRAADAKADVFSLGASLFAAIEGRSPYGEFEHVMGYLARALEGHVDPPQQAGPLTEPLTALLEVEPGKRPDAAEARALLTRAAPPPAHIQQYVQEHLSPDRDARETLRLRRTLALPSRTLRLGRTMRGRRRALTVTATALAVAGLAVGLALFGPWGFGHQGGNGADAKPSATVQAGAMGDARSADPCKVLDDASLSRFGHTELAPTYGKLNRCDVLVQSSGGDEIADAEVDLSSDLQHFDSSVPVRRVGNVEVASLKRDGDQCLRFITTPDRGQIVVNGKREGAGAPDPCALSDAAVDHAVTVLDQGPVPRRSAAWPANSLGRLDACALLDPAVLKKVPGLQQRPTDRGFADWTCDWASPDGQRAYVQLQFTQDNDLSDNGQPAQIAGTASHVAPKEEGDDSCVVYTPHRTFTDSVGGRTIELFRLTLREQGQPNATVCAGAEALAGAAVQNIAKSMPGK